jgi:hypothetical protein
MAGLKWGWGPADEPYMAVVIKAECPGCGVVRLGAPDLTVRVCSDDGSSAYTFQCRECGAAVHHDISSGVVELLVSAGVQRTDWRWPAELSEHTDAPPLTVDDLLDFHLLASSDDTFDRALVALLEGADRPTA